MAERSAEYRRCLKESKQHHRNSKTYSGRLLRPHAPFIKEIIDRHGCKSVLDYGAGKGRQYEWVSHGGDASIPKGMTIERFWGVLVTKYDPAWKPFSQEPTGQFDLVICTHTLGSIPVADLGWVIDRIFGYARKAVYIAEKIGDVHKQVFSQPDIMPRWTAEQWREFVAARKPSHIECTLATREETDKGVIVTRVII